MAFWSDARNLVPGDTNGVADAFVHDRQTGATARVSVSSAGGQGNGVTRVVSISADGRFVAFASVASNLVPGDTNGARDIFVHDRQTGTTTRVAVSSAGTQGNADSEDPWISADGGFVAFESYASNLVPGDTNGVFDAFLHDRQTGATTRVSVDSGGAQGNNSSFLPSISADGRLVAFNSLATNLVPGDTNGGADVFVHDRQTGATTRVSVDSAGAQGDLGSYASSISADGRFVALRSYARNLVPGDTNGVDDIFVHDRQTGATTRVSVDSAGAQGNNSNFFPSISADGRFVAFQSYASNLVPGDTNGWGADVFVHDRIDLTFNGVAASGNSVSFTVSNAFGEGGNLVWVLLSCTGTSGFPLPGGRIVPLTRDACTDLSLGVPAHFSTSVGNSGTANTSVFTFPSLPPRLTFYAAAVTVDLTLPSFVSITGPISFVTQ